MMKNLTKNKIDDKNGSIKFFERIFVMESSPYTEFNNFWRTVTINSMRQYVDFLKGSIVAGSKASYELCRLIDRLDDLTFCVIDDDTSSITLDLMGLNRCILDFGKSQNLRENDEIEDTFDVAL